MYAKVPACRMTKNNFVLGGYHFNKEVIKLKRRQREMLLPPRIGGERFAARTGQHSANAKESLLAANLSNGVRHVDPASMQGGS